MVVQKTVSFIYKIKKIGLPEYLFNMIPQSNHKYNTRSIEDIATIYCRTDVFKYSYFPNTILEWNKLYMQIRRSGSFLFFKNSLLKTGQPTAKPTYNIHNPIGLKFLTRLRLATLLDDLLSVDRNIPSFSDNELVDLLLYGSPHFNLNQNNKILSSSISFIIKSERFSGSLF